VTISVVSWMQLSYIESVWSFQSFLLRFIKRNHSCIILPHYLEYSVQCPFIIVFCPHYALLSLLLAGVKMNYPWHCMSLEILPLIFVKFTYVHDLSKYAMEILATLTSADSHLCLFSSRKTTNLYLGSSVLSVAYNLFACTKLASWVNCRVHFICFSSQELLLCCLIIQNLQNFFMYSDFYALQVEA
jgi:hypothetical protein